MCEAQETMPRPGRQERGPCKRCDGRAQYIIRDLLLCRCVRSTTLPPQLLPMRPADPSPCFIKHVQYRIGRTCNGPLSGSSRPNVSMRPPPQAGDALIALSGGAGSTALLDFLAQRKYLGVEGAEYDSTRGKTPPIWGRAYAVHVVFPDSWEGRAGVGARLRAMAQERGVRYLEVRAEDVFDASLGVRVRAMVDGSAEEGELEESCFSQLTPGPDNSARLAALLASLPPPSRPTLLGLILDALLSTVAASLPNISHLILGETATREAQRVISGTAQGRGWSLPLDLATLGCIPLLTEERREVMRLRGVREVSVKEAALYCHARGLETFNFRLWGRGRKEGSIEGLTERESATGGVRS